MIDANGRQIDRLPAATGHEAITAAVFSTIPSSTPTVTINFPAFRRWERLTGRTFSDPADSEASRYNRCAEDYILFGQIACPGFARTSMSR